MKTNLNSISNLPIALKTCILFVVLICVSTATFGQAPGKAESSIFKSYYDSLKQTDYPYLFPILGKQAYKRGYDLQNAYGISGIYFTQTQQININRTRLGINGGDLVDFSDFIQFGPTIATTNAYTVRPDIWVLPFLNVYGILGGGTTETDINLDRPIGFSTKQKFGARSFGLGVTLGGAVGPIWLAWDNNYNFVDVDVIVEPMPAFNSSFRVGHTILSPKNPQRSLSVWGGVFYQKLNNDTKGSIAFSDVFPIAGEGLIIDNLKTWAETLPPAQRIIVNQFIDKLEDIANGIDTDDIIIDYELDKEVAAPFNLIFGAQYQFNKRWILRTELGVFGKRSQFLLNLNYRIPGFKKVNK